MRSRSADERQAAPGEAGLRIRLPKTGQIDKALAEYQRFCSKTHLWSRPNITSASSTNQGGNYIAAADAYKRAIARRPSDWEGYSELGEIYYSSGKFAEAAEQFKSVIELAPDSPNGYYNLGAAYLGVGRNEDAIQILNKGLSLAPDANAWANLGSAYMYVGKNEEAIAAMQKAVQLLPHNHVVWRDLGDSYDQVPSHLADASRTYQKALDVALAQLKVNPNDPDVLSGIGLYYAHLKQPQLAEQYIQRALQASPKNSDSLFTAALIYEIIGHRDKAIGALGQAVKEGYSFVFVEEEPELRKLRSDQRYRHWIQSRSANPNYFPN